MVVSKSLADLRNDMNKDEETLRKDKNELKKHEDTIRIKTQEIQKLEAQIEQARSTLNRENAEKAKIDQEIRGLEQKRLEHQRELSDIQRQLQQGIKSN